MIFCTACGTENADGTKFCVRCGATLAPSQPAPGSWQSQSSELNVPPPSSESNSGNFGQGGESGSPNPYAAPYPNSQQPDSQQASGQPYAAPPPVSGYAPGYNPTAPSYQMQPVMNMPRGGGLGAVGEKRDPVMVIVLTLVTCGLYAFYWWYVAGCEMRDALRRPEINPIMDFVLVFVTCGIWGIYMYYKYPQLIMEMQDRVGMPRNDISVISILCGVFGMGFISFFLMQQELNKVWDANTQRG